MGWILFGIPLLLLAVGVFLGFAKLYNALLGFVFWIAISMALYSLSLYAGFQWNDPSTLIFGFVIAIFLLAISVWVACLFGFITEPVRPSPAEKVYRAYSKLDPHEKGQVNAWLKFGVGIAAGYASDTLRQKGKIKSAEAVDKIQSVM